MSAKLDQTYEMIKSIKGVKQVVKSETSTDYMIWVSPSGMDGILHHVGFSQHIHGLLALGDEVTVKRDLSIKHKEQESNED